MSHRYNENGTRIHKSIVEYEGETACADPSIVSMIDGPPIGRTADQLNHTCHFILKILGCSVTPYRIPPNTFLIFAQGKPVNVMEGVGMGSG